MEHFDDLDKKLEGLRRVPRAQPPEALFSKIAAGIEEEENQSLSPGGWRRLAVAACLLIALNASCMVYYFQQGQANELAEAQEYGLISDYQLYE
ncbi:MAG: hypothetical protein AAFP02_12255 [Bacteroidota bacterium]